MSINSVYMCNRFSSVNYHRPPVYKCKDYFKEANSRKEPIIVDKIDRHEYIAFPKNYKFDNEDIYLSMNDSISILYTTHTNYYRCVGIEVRSLLRFCWIPIEEVFFEKLLIEFSNPSTNQYRLFKGISGDNIVNGGFKIENGFLRLDK